MPAAHSSTHAARSPEGAFPFHFHILSLTFWILVNLGARTSPTLVDIF